MSCIWEIRLFIQEYAETIADVLEVNVTIVDENCVRVGGTGPHLGTIGQPVPHGSFFHNILQTGKPEVVNSRLHNGAECQSCIELATCSELITMGFPIFMHGLPVGVIGIIAFTLEQKDKMVSTSEKLWSFMTHMSGLLESKLLLQEMNHHLQSQVSEAMAAANKNNAFASIIGNSAALQQVLGRAKQIASSLSNVLIRGESGTGKELLARAIHAESKQRQLPFVAVNCASIPESLLESELFGYEGGAFTGANKNGAIGKFELANNGTILLDEIGDMPLALQPKLLRVLQEKTVDRIGGRKPIPINVRIMAATNKDLETMVEQGTFREDLYYRLNVIPLFIPPLRQRREDIPAYLKHYIEKYGKMVSRGNLILEPALYQWLRDYDWPGNVRQLQNVVEYMVNMARSNVINCQDLPYYLVKKQEGVRKSKAGLDEMTAEYEKNIINSYLQSDFSIVNKKKIAQELKISLATLYRKLAVCPV